MSDPNLNSGDPSVLSGDPSVIPSEVEGTLSSNHGFKIDSMTGNPSTVEVAALGAAISLWAQSLGISQSNDAPVDNTVDIAGMLRAIYRNPAGFSSNMACFSNKSSGSWSLANKLRSRK